MNNFYRHISLFLSLIFTLPLITGCDSEPNAPTPPSSGGGTVQQMKPLSSIPKGERIIFVKKEIRRIWIVDDSIDVGTGNIWSMAPDGSGQQQHTDLSKNFFVTNNPKLSYNGKYLTFTSNYKSWLSSCYTDVFKWDQTTNKIIRVSGDEWPPETPATNYVTLKVLSLEKDVRISAKGCQSFTFTGEEVIMDQVNYYRTYIKVPASSYIWIKAEKSETVGGVVFGYMSGTGTNEVVVADSYIPKVTMGHSNNDGKVVAITSGKLTMWKEDGSLIWEHNVGGHSWGISDAPVWSHDGTKIALGLGLMSYSNAIAILSPPESENAPTPIVGDQSGVWVYMEPSWSPDDTELIFSAASTSADGNVPNIYRISAAGGNPVQLTNYSGYYCAVNPCYSPDGTKIAFTVMKCRSIIFQSLLDFTLSSNIESANIWTMNADGSGLQQLTTDGMSYHPNWGVVN